MGKARLEKMLSLYRNYSTDEDLIEMVAELRDSFLDHDLVSRQTGYDIADVTPTGPDHVIYYIAEYINILEKQAERVQELEKIKQAHIEELGYVDERLLEAEAQNQRYKEALIEVKKSLHLVQIFEPWVSVANEIIDRVLEGEE